jgi:son of sevenless-like protein
MHSHLVIDTTAASQTGPSSLNGRYNTRSVSPAYVRQVYSTRNRSVSNASTSSSISVISPATSSTNASRTSLLIPATRQLSRSRSASPDIDETVRLGPEFVLAMHDYTPQSGNATCLSFRAGQVIHVHNRDSSGWWDGEIEGRRGWFPSNYVNAEIVSLTEEEPIEFQSVCFLFPPST